ncbi:alpha/beta hydrolase [Kitasatospora sp. MAA19]|uniref:alpha/beta hydrolase family protein n=1 Tax=Kitasatospora sp. MAA19 TaxID=3035090 RepID=UPI00247632C8|nr:alpha/beta hydrolase [Kitasatospora sp. MAA19]
MKATRRVARYAVSFATAAVIIPLSVSASAVAAPAAPPLTALSTPTARTASALLLPRPTGRYAVGRDTLHLVDPRRTDPWVPQSGPRQLMVDLYYPAVAGSGTPAPYMSTAEATALINYAGLSGPLAPTTLADTRIWTRANAVPARGRYPLVVLSPGFTVPRYTLTALAEELGSRGFVVATVDHAYESAATRFPGGILPCAACDEYDAGTITQAQVAAGRAQDVSFLLTELTGPHPVWRYADLIDPARIGMAGHSIGGDATLATMLADRRVLAGADLDGPITPPVPATGIDGRPVLLIAAADPSSPDIVPTWTSSWPDLNGWKRWLTVAGADHYTFTDLDYLINESGVLSIPSAPRSIAITTSYVSAFFERQLKGVCEPLLNGPSRDFPEVTFTSS